MIERRHYAAIDSTFTEVSAHFCHAVITISEQYVERLYLQASKEQQKALATQGFIKGTTPLSYISKNFQPHIIEHVKEFFFKYYVLNQLYREIAARKIFLAGEPRLTEIVISPSSAISYHFSITVAQPILLQGWKRIPFKAPKRKNYKDLDRQVTQFLEEEALQKQAMTNTVSIGDWICFSLTLLDDNNKPVFDIAPDSFWLKIGSEEVDLPFYNLFKNKKMNDSFTSQDHILQECFSEQIETFYTFLVTINDIVPHIYFSTDLFKKQFHLRSNKEHAKLIEVFSYRNDLSQRRATVEDTLKLLLSKHYFEAPHHLILRQQKEILESVQSSHDYQVYKLQNDFNDKVKSLAIKQVRESIIILQMALYENMSVTRENIKEYLNLTKRSRTREFIYFTPPVTKHFGREMPINEPYLAHTCLKEKTLNHIIYYLTKQKNEPT